MVVANFYFFKAGRYLIALNLELIIQVLSRRRWHAREKKILASERG